MTKRISVNDFQEMRNFYIDMLRLRNYNDEFYYALLSEFDKAVSEKDMNKIVKIMGTVNVELI